MIGMQIVLDEEKIEKENKYDIEKIHMYLVEKSYKYNFAKLSNNWYIGKSLEDCNSIINEFLKIDWFKEYIIEWILYFGNDDSYEDLKQKYKI